MQIIKIQTRNTRGSVLGALTRLTAKSNVEAGRPGVRTINLIIIITISLFHYVVHRTVGYQTILTSISNFL